VSDPFDRSIKISVPERMAVKFQVAKALKMEMRKLAQ
jgi:hypothetical protein